MRALWVDRVARPWQASAMGRTGLLVLACVLVVVSAVLLFVGSLWSVVAGLAAAVVAWLAFDRTGR